MLLFCAVLPAFAEEPRVEKNPPPGWVVPYQLLVPQNDPPAGIENGNWFLLRDDQSDLRTQTRYRHVASKLVSATGVQEGSKVTVTFDPTFQKISFHHLVVWRDGKAIDRLPQQEIKLLHREKELDRHLYDGRVSAVLILDDMRVGDVLDYAFSWTGENPIFRGNFSEYFPTQWDVPIQYARCRIVCPDNRKLTFKCFNGQPDPNMQRIGSNVEYLWERSQVPPLVEESETPKWYDPFPGFEFSEYSSWQEVAIWAAALHGIPQEIPAELREIVASLETKPERTARVLAALHYVQANIRYLGLEVGPNSHEPYPINTVLQRRFGDCKDKTRLLCTILRAMGMEATPALVSTVERGEIAQRLPSPDAFNHIVTFLRLDDREYWLDATCNKQGGRLEDVYVPAYGKALLADATTTGLKDVQPAGLGETVTEVLETFRIPDYSGSCQLLVRTSYRGDEADEMRITLADTNRQVLEKENLNFYARDYPAIKQEGGLQFTDDFERNEVVTTESYKIANLWKADEDEEDADYIYANFYPRLFRAQIAQPRIRLRTMPLRLKHPTHFRQTIRIETASRDSKAPLLREIRDPAFHVTYKREVNDGVTQLQYAIDTFADHIEPVATGDYLANTQKVLDLLSYRVEASRQGSRSTVGQVAAASAGIGGRLFLLVSSLTGVAIVWQVFRSVKRGSGHDIGSGADLHRCCVCGRTDRSHPELEFRVGTNGEDYCREHI